MAKSTIDDKRRKQLRDASRRYYQRRKAERILAEPYYSRDYRNSRNSRNSRKYSQKSPASIVSEVSNDSEVSEVSNISNISIPSSPEFVPITEMPVSNVQPGKYKKANIPKSVRTHVWNHYVGPHINEHRCLCCKRGMIKITEFEVGHVQSEADGGTMEITNLRPICAVCNHSMGRMNMVDYIKKYGYYL